MTEIPEHLLARSKARRDAIGQSGADDAPAEGAAPSAAVEKAESAAPAAAAGPAGVPAVAPSKAPPAPVAAPPPPPRPEVAAALARKKIPFWAAPAVILLPGWAFLYAWTLEPREELSPAIAAGQEIYEANCGTCHGPQGGGGVGPAFEDGAVIETFSDFEEHVQWVTLGSNDWPEPTYGDTAKPVSGGMPPFGGRLSEEEIVEVVRYEREVLSGHGCEVELAEATGEECEPGTEAEATEAASE